MSKLRVLSPIGAIKLEAAGLAPRRRDLAGLRLGILHNGKPNGDVLLDRAATYLEENFGVIRTVNRRKRNTSLGAEFIDEFSAQCDIALLGVGD